MEKFEHVKSKSSLLFSAAILILVMVFTFTSCMKPQEKGEIIDNGKWAIDMTRASGGPGGDIAIFVKDIDRSVNPPIRLFPSFQGQPFTLEAWIEKLAAIDLDGGVFSRCGDGVALWFDDNVPKFGMIHSGVGPNTSSTYHALPQNGAAVSDGWTHVAVVMENKDHTGLAGHPLCYLGSTGVLEGAAGIESEQPHMDLYVDGVLVGCASTHSHPDDVGGGVPQYPKDPAGDEITVIGRIDCAMDGSANVPPPSGGNGSDGLAAPGEKFDGVIDEVRIWGKALTVAEINACMNQELRLGGPCSYANPILFAYWPMQDGPGKFSATDWKGLGLDGDIQSPTNAFNNPWPNAWVQQGWPCTNC